MKRLLLLGACLLALLIWYSSTLKRPVDADSQERITVAIEKGMSAAAVSHLLEERGLIRSEWAFRREVSRKDAAASIKAGTYVLRPSQTPEQMLEVLIGGANAELPFTIPEGFTVADIDAASAKLGLSASGAIVACANDCAFAGIDFLPPKAGLAARGGRVEGYLYPDTYFVDPETFDPEAFLLRLLKTFDARVIVGKKSDIAASGRSLHEIVTMASLIEEETRTADERPIVAGILWKRLDASVGLQVDATVRYLLQKPTAAITRADLDTDSAYNTRKYRGLPPGPIASPGLSSIEAALAPEDSPYWYYLHGNDGRIRYAETNDEHNVNRARYL